MSFYGNRLTPTLSAVAVLALSVLVGAPRRTFSEAPAVTRDARLDAGGRAEFDRVYRLAPGQLIKRVPPPFVPERSAVFQDMIPGPAGRSGPDFIVFSGKPGGGVQEFGRVGRGGQFPLRRVLTLVLHASPQEIDGPNELLSLDLPGDWVIDPDAPLAETLKGMTPVIREAHGRLVRFERRSVERDAIVASGRFALKPLPDVRDLSAIDPTIFLFAGLRDPARGGQTSGTPREFFDALGRCVGHPVVDETEGTRPAAMKWVPQISAEIARQDPGPTREENLRTLLDNVSLQTGLKFERARRKVPTWVVVEGPAAG